MEGSGTWRVKPAETAANLTRSRKRHFLIQRYWEWKRWLFSAVKLLSSGKLDLVNKQTWVMNFSSLWKQHCKIPTYLLGPGKKALFKPLIPRLIKSIGGEKQLPFISRSV